MLANSPEDVNHEKKAQTWPEQDVVSDSLPAPWRLHEGFADSVVAHAFVAKPEDLATANSTLWYSVESDDLDPEPTTSSALHKSKNASNCARDVNKKSLKHARNPSFSGDFLHAIVLLPARARDYLLRLLQACTHLRER